MSSRIDELATSAVAEVLGAIAVVLTLLYLDHASGTLADDIWEARVNNIRTWMAKPGVVRWLDELGSHVHPSFRRFVTTLPDVDP